MLHIYITNNIASRAKANRTSRNNRKNPQRQPVIFAPFSQQLIEQVNGKSLIT